jgi:hypothetical protein
MKRPLEGPARPRPFPNPVGNVYGVYRKAVVAVCVLVSIVAASLGLRTALTAGPIWDDPTTINMMTILVAMGTQPNQSYEAGTALLEEAAESGAGYYGVATQFMAHGLETIANGESWYKITYSVEAIRWRHLICFLLTMCCTGALFLTVAVVSGNWILGTMMPAVLLSTPVFLGLSVIDEKDAPIAAGLTLLSCGASLLLWRVCEDEGGPRPSKLLVRRWVANALAAAMVFLGTFVAFGTRVGAAALIAVECVIVCFLLLLTRPRGLARVASAVSLLLLAVCAGALLAVIINPLGRKAPIQWIMGGILYAAGIPAKQPLKVYGQTINSGALPWWYVPGWILAEYSAAFLALCFVGCFGAILLWWRKSKIKVMYPWVPFVVQGFMFPLGIIMSGAVLHDRLRHLLFMVPPLCMLAALGLYLCVDGVRVTRHWTTKTLAALGPAFLLINFATTLIWYPYQYAYLSETARLFPQFAFDSEPLGLSIHEAVERMRQHGVTKFRAGPAPTFVSYDPKQWGIAVDYVSLGYAPHRRPVRGGGAYYLHSRPSWDAAGLPSFCRTLFRIERQGVILGVGGEC